MVKLFSIEERSMDRIKRCNEKFKELFGGTLTTKEGLDLEFMEAYRGLCIPL